MEFLRSSFCDSSACLEVAFDGELVQIRTSGAPDFPVIATREEWDAFALGLRAGEFDQIEPV